MTNNIKSDERTAQAKVLEHNAKLLGLEQANALITAALVCRDAKVHGFFNAELALQLLACLARMGKTMSYAELHKATVNGHWNLFAIPEQMQLLQHMCHARNLPDLTSLVHNLKGEYIGAEGWLKGAVNTGRCVGDEDPQIAMAEARLECFDYYLSN